MNNIVIKRLMAYFIDFIIVALIASCFSYLSFINPNRVQYEEKYQEILTLYDKLEQKEITKEEYEAKYYTLYYDLNHLNINYAFINLVVLIGYFGIFQWQSGGQTIGKRILKIKITTKEDKNPSVVSYLIRTLVLNNIIITLLEIFVLFLFSANDYYPLYSNINLVGYILLYIIAFFFLVRSDHRGLHDLIASTKVVMVSPSDEEEIQEAKYEEVLKKPKKSTKTKT